MSKISPRANPMIGLAAASSLVFGLAGCGAGDSNPSASAVPSAASQTRFDSHFLQPHYHLAPLILEEPSFADADGSQSSVYATGHLQPVLERLEHISSKRLSYDALRHATDETIRLEGASPAASATTVVTTYTPAQIRQAYQLPPLTGVNFNAALTAATAAQFGSAQTIYIIDAYNDPNVISDLSKFNTQFGLPSCSTVSIPVNETLPLTAPKSGSGCQLSVVYATAAGKLTATVPAYNSGWVTEIALDTQWAHATAPMARIILIEAADASAASLLGAMTLANTMGPGVVSMSFGAAEGSYVPSYDTYFTAKGTNYVASTGDSGEGIQWPAVSPHVLGVGGTSVTISTAGTRTEVAWPDSGGGLSVTEALPSWQPAYNIPASGSTRATASTHRELPDVAFNANPYTGQYVYLTAPGAATGNWLSAGGTSLAAPQWVGILTIANAQRALAGKSPLSAAQPDLYQDIYAVKGNYATDMLDVTSGSNGSCPTCNAATGYDLVTGLGTPNAVHTLAVFAQY
ncbi:MAG: S53 family peptidase [Burkholderiaceae bacterium]